MDKFNKGKKFGGGGSRGGSGGGRSFGGDRGGSRSFGGGRDGDRPTMHKATCSDCGNSCEVPFRPTGDKPVFCSDCFKDKRGDSRDSRDSRGSERNSRPSFENKRPYQNEGSKDTTNYKAQFEMLNTKIDKILKALSPDVTEEVNKMAEAPKSTKFEKAPKKEVDVVALKKALSNTKVAQDNKAVAKKEVASKKVATKKAPAKKAPAKKVVKKSVAKNKKK
ncbi:hypothetical protein A2442_00195 [Candidatus Campbellbacteria bacterium RIFOXYC2_FULL_35_25]|uniref:CxxC-x17-CxxC domain-containing protein n=1 Tax=Candidatus Campbellbacteria bacterium RIFOXYC2_FULL_35_25 TaxID=1797582 RepID=A0A1F5EGY3_9BACT|nr:MAG: hypothetical protein A2442_00195 [Candidatus Campbellbacteria bacterium RIFOXYC2_FULL_35_25]